MPTLVVELTSLAGVGTWVHADASFGYAGLVAAFTAPIISVGFDWGEADPDENQAEALARRVMARLSQSCIGCAITVVGSLLWQTDAHRGRPLLKTYYEASLRGMLAAISHLKAHAPLPSADERSAVRRAARRLAAEANDLQSLLRESASEPSIYPQAPFPQFDYEGAVRGLEATWSRLLELLQLKHRARADLGGHAAQCRRQLMHLAGALLTTIEATVQRLSTAMRITEDAAATEVYELQLLGMYDLQAALQRHWADADAALDKSMAQLIKAMKRPPSEGEPHPVVDYLAQCASLGVLHSVGEHVSNMAWRLVNIIEKEHPAASFLSEPTDLYKFEVAI